MIETVMITEEDGLGIPRREPVSVKPFKKIHGTNSTVGRCWIGGAQYEVVRHGGGQVWHIVGRTSATDSGKVNA